MKKWKEYYLADKKRNINSSKDTLLLLYFLRKSQFSKNTIMNKVYGVIYKMISKKYLLEIPRSLNVGKGFYIGHMSCITINSNAHIGNNCNIHKGVTIGQENRGTKKGCPTIGNKVWIGINATIVGKINIGDDVLIAPNSYVNCDVPSHSIVFGNPCIIKSRENATESYINNVID